MTRLIQIMKHPGSMTLTCQVRGASQPYGVVKLKLEAPRPPNEMEITRQFISPKHCAPTLYVYRSTMGQMIWEVYILTIPTLISDTPP